MSPAGFFGAYVFDGSTWHDLDPDSGEVPGVAVPWSTLDIHDSDFAILRYKPARLGSRTAYLGYTPRTYFDDESASAPADVPREAAGLASWLARQQGRTDEAELRELIAPFLAGDVPEQSGDDDDLEDGDLDDADAFVEVKMSRFLKSVGLPVPGGLLGVQGRPETPLPLPAWPARARVIVQMTEGGACQVSQNFKVGDTMVWNPSNGVGRLFVRSADALASVVGLPTGIRLGYPGDPDEWVIDMPIFEAFVDALVDRYQRSTHLILRSLMEGFIATALVLVERGGGHVPSLGAERGPDLSDVPVSTHGFGARAPAGRLGELSTAHSRAMPD